MDDTTQTRDTRSREAARAPSQIAQYARHARAMADAHARDLLTWMWQWRIVDHHIVRRLLKVPRSSAYRIIVRLRRLGLVQPVMVSGTPAHPWMLTPAGVDAIAPHLDYNDIQVPPVTAPDRIRVAQVPHDLLAQHFVLRIARNPLPKITSIIDTAHATAIANAGYDLHGPVTEIQSAAWVEATAEARPATGKYPDAIIEVYIDASTGASIRIAIECQQTPEPLPTIRRIMSGYCTALAAGDIHALVYCSTRPSIPPYYHAEMSRSLRPWHRTPSRRWVPDDGPTPYREWMREHVMTVDAPDLEGRYYPVAARRVWRDAIFRDAGEHRKYAPHGDIASDARYRHRTRRGRGDHRCLRISPAPARNTVRVAYSRH